MLSDVINFKNDFLYYHFQDRIEYYVTTRQGGVHCGLALVVKHSRKDPFLTQT